MLYCKLLSVNIKDIYSIYIFRGGVLLYVAHNYNFASFSCEKLIKKLYTMSIKTFYTSPEISVRQMNVERGFAASPQTLDDLVNKNEYFTITAGESDNQYE